MGKSIREHEKAISYLRTSSASNVGSDKDSDRRQREAISAFASRSGFAIVDEFYDAAVSGADPIEVRPGFAALLDRIEGNGVRTVLVEDASRFARDLVTQELGILLLIGRGVRVLTATGDDLTATDDPFKVAMRQIAGSFAQLEKARLVAKLKAARDRKRQDTGKKVEGRKSHHESRPDAVALAKRLRRASPKTGSRRTLQEISQELALGGHLNSKGKPFSASAIKSMLESYSR
jgi:DNA invertase Pin-like site-specific DNA recombinase